MSEDEQENSREVFVYVNSLKSLLFVYLKFEFPNKKEDQTKISGLNMHSLV